MIKHKETKQLFKEEYMYKVKFYDTRNIYLYGLFKSLKPKDGILYKIMRYLRYAVDKKLCVCRVEGRIRNVYTNNLKFATRFAELVDQYPHAKGFSYLSDVEFHKPKVHLEADTIVLN